MTPHAAQVPFRAGHPPVAPYRPSRTLMIGLLGGLLASLVVIVAALSSETRQRWIAPHSSDQLQSFPPRPDVLDLSPPPSP